MSDQIKTLAQPGGRGRVACAKAVVAGPELIVALKRALPFLARKRLPIKLDTARCVSFADLAADDQIVYTSAFSEKTTNARGLVFFDEAALARVLDGALGGGDATKLPSLKLTSAQNALALRVTASVMKAFAEALAGKLGLSVEPSSNKEIDAGVAVVLGLCIDGEGGGVISVALPLACIRVDEPSEPPKVDDGIAAAMLEVDVDIVAELGKVRLSLDAIARLQVGDVVRLSLPLDERARVSAGGAVLFHGRPTASGDVVAVALERMAG
jgi:flagellar motor switch protein FliM